MDGPPERPASGDPATFVALHDALADRLHHYLASMLGASADADDVLQETFLRLARDRDRLGEVDDPTAFAFAVARNEARRWLDARRRRADRAAAARDLFVEADSDDPEAREAAEDAAIALAALDPRDREVVELKIFAGLTFREIGAIVGRPLGTVASRYQSALGRMRSALTRRSR
ncbi:RNA polymerase sigma factor [Paludisphaera sp.]|uniref:RNA polymerase sigma factor n=1 Tax=Paludisphaera sp. TaxID=2017432 RepID=UPI00301E38FB